MVKEILKVVCDPKNGCRGNFVGSCDDRHCSNGAIGSFK